jgi:hypothetical protein
MASDLSVDIRGAREMRTACAHLRAAIGSCKDALATSTGESRQWIEAIAADLEAAVVALTEPQPNLLHSQETVSWAPPGVTEAAAAGRPAPADPERDR